MSEMASVFTEARAQSMTIALTTVARCRPAATCQTSARWASSSTANDSTAPFVAHSCATGSTDSGKTPIASRLSPSPVIACGISRVAMRRRLVGGARSRSRIRSTHDEQAMMAPLRNSPALNVRLEKSPIMPSRLK